MKRSYSTVEVIDLTISSEDESEKDVVWPTLNEIVFRTEEVFTEVEVRVSSPIPKVPKLKKVHTNMIMDSSCVVTPSLHSVPNPDVDAGVSTESNPVFNRLPNRFYCYCNKTQAKHTHEKYLAMRGLTEDHKVYWNCRSRASPSGCNFFAWDPIKRTLD
jgi:hypothetical protein